MSFPLGTVCITTLSTLQPLTPIPIYFCGVEMRPRFVPMGIRDRSRTCSIRTDQELMACGCIQPIAVLQTRQKWISDRVSRIFFTMKGLKGTDLKISYESFQRIKKKYLKANRMICIKIKLLKKIVCLSAIFSLGWFRKCSSDVVGEKPEIRLFTTVIYGKREVYIRCEGRRSVNKGWNRVATYRSDYLVTTKPSWILKRNFRNCAITFEYDKQCAEIR